MVNDAAASLQRTQSSSSTVRSAQSKEMGPLSSWYWESCSEVGESSFVLPAVVVLVEPTLALTPCVESKSWEIFNIHAIC